MNAFQFADALLEQLNQRRQFIQPTVQFRDSWIGFRLRDGDGRDKD
jgi:hypothetical protein